MKVNMNFLEKNYKVDYHIHTPHSDGNFGIADIIKRAKDNNVKEISLTDHDSIEVYDYLHKVDGINIITGVEISVVVDDFRIEILGYNFDVQKMKKFKFLHKEERRKIFQKVLNRLLKVAKENGAIVDKVKIGEYPLLGWSLYKEVSKRVENIDFIKKHKLTNNFNRLLNDKDFVFYTHPEEILPTIEQAAKIIRDAGGIVVLAHPYKYKQYPNGMEGIDLCRYLYKKGLIDGIEVAHSGHNVEQIKKLYNFAKRHGLVITFGSDYHGNLTWNKYDCEVGMLTNLGVDSQQVKKMLKK